MIRFSGSYIMYVIENNLNFKKLRLKIFKYKKLNNKESTLNIYKYFSFCFRLLFIKILNLKLIIFFLERGGQNNNDTCIIKI